MRDLKYYSREEYLQAQQEQQKERSTAFTIRFNNVKDKKAIDYFRALPNKSKWIKCKILQEIEENEKKEEK